MEVAAALSGRPSSRRPSRHTPPHPLGCRISMRKVKGYQRRDVEFFVNSQAVCLSLPMIRSLRCLRNAKGPSRASPARNSRGFSSRRFSSSLTCTHQPFSLPLPLLLFFLLFLFIVLLLLLLRYSSFFIPFFHPLSWSHCSRSPPRVVLATDLRQDLAVKYDGSLQDALIFRRA